MSDPSGNRADHALVPASAADAEALAAIRAAAMRPSLEAVGRFDPQRARDRFLSTFRAGDTQLILVDGTVAGLLVVRRRPDHLYLDHLYLVPACQGRGIGRCVVAAVQAMARDQGLPVRLMALNGSPANGFYASCGFREIAADSLDTTYEWRADAAVAP